MASIEPRSGTRAGVARVAGLCLMLLANRSSRAAEADFFENQVRPLLAERCYECHSSKASKVKGGLALDTVTGLRRGGTTGPLFLAGQPESSLLIQAVRGTAHDLDRMPSKGEKLTPQEVRALEEWIRRGAPLPPEPAGTTAMDPRKHWAFQKPVAAPVPSPKPGAPPYRNPVDAFVSAALESRGLTAAPEADRRTFLRRATFDVTGLPPTPSEMASFLADTSPDALERAVDRLLASPRYGERWGRHWLDVARYADTKGYVFEEERRYPASFTYRDWVVSALNRDLPYDQFLIAQVAGDSLVLGEDRTPLAALGFLTLGRRFLNNQSDIIDDRLDVVFRGVQGLTVQCARCHDHKFDPISTADYYSLYGVFASSHEPDPKPLIGANPNPTLAAEYEAERLRRVKERDDFQADKVEQARRELRERVGDYLLAVHDARQAGDKREELIRSRKLSPRVVERWDRKLEEWTREPHPIFAPYAAFRALATNEFAAQAPALAQRFAANADAAHRLNPLIAELFATNAPGSFLEVVDRFAVRFKQVNAEWQKRLKDAADAKVPPPKDLPEADWEALRQVLYDGDSPVMVNWDLAYRIVPTPDQQKYRALQRRLDELDATHPGAPLRAMALADNSTPTEPVIFKRGNPGNPGPKVPRQFLEILDPNRTPFRQGSGRLELGRALASRDNPLTARVMVNRIWLEYFGMPLVNTPSDFGLRSDPPTHPELLDWLAVQFMDQGWSLKQLHRLILTSEAYRRTSDPAPSAAMAENEKRDPANTYLWRMNRKRADFEALRDSLLFVAGRLDFTVGGQAVEIYNDRPANRRTLYGFIDRQNLPGVLRSFDFASPDTSSSMRFRTTVPQQALYLLNSAFTAELARQFVARPEVAAADSDDERIQRLYAIAFQRAPAQEEIEAATEFIARAATVSTPVAASGASASGSGALGASRRPLNPWERYAQALLAANEFVFID